MIWSSDAEAGGLEGFTGDDGAKATSCRGKVAPTSRLGPRRYPGVAITRHKDRNLELYNHPLHRISVTIISTASFEKASHLQERFESLRQDASDGSSGWRFAVENRSEFMILKIANITYMLW